ncbi:MAG TPA: cytochrome D1 domain-containing protein [Myxococcota bacterium]
MIRCAAALAALASVGVAAALGCASGERAADVGPREVYQQHCAACHGARRYGGYAPPLMPETLERKDDAALVQTILAGRPNTQMPAFGDRIGTEMAASLVGLFREPVRAISWTLPDIAASRVEPEAEERPLPAGVRRENLTLVVERGRGAVSILDGDSLRELGRFEAGAIHGGLKFDRDLRVVMAVTRDGTALAYDLLRGRLRARVKVGVNARNIALSPDGAFAAVANQLPAGLVLLDGALRPLASIPVEGQPSGVYPLPGQARFALALRDVSRLVTVGYPDLDVRSVELPEPFEDLVFVPGSTRLVASSRDGHRLVLYDFASGEVLASLATQGLPHLFSACFFEHAGVPYAAFNHVGIPKLSIVDMQAFAVREEIPLRGSGFFARTHEGTPYLWVDTNTEAIQLVDKRTLSLAPRALVPAVGKKAMHVEFTAEGDKAFVSVWHPEGAVVVYDSNSLAELARIPYAMPVGKYNAANKTRLLQ